MLPTIFNNLLIVFSSCKRKFGVFLFVSLKQKRAFLYLFALSETSNSNAKQNGTVRYEKAKMKRYRMKRKMPLAALTRSMLSSIEMITPNDNVHVIIQPDSNINIHIRSDDNINLIIQPENTKC